MAKYITATITENISDVLCISLVDNTTTIRKFTTGKVKPEKALKAIQARFDTTERKALHILSTDSTENKYRMTESKFLEKSVVLENRPTNERFITRTLEKAVCKTLCINTENNETSVETFTTAYMKTSVELLARIKAENPGKILPLYILETSIYSALYGMTENDFIKYGEIVTD